MKLYIGGAFAGQNTLAEKENPDKKILHDFHLVVEKALENKEDMALFTQKILEEYKEGVVVSDEMGSGVVPIKREDRMLREHLGRALCVLAQNAHSVTRVVCGIGVKIK